MSQDQHKPDAPECPSTSAERVGRPGARQPKVKKNYNRVARHGLELTEAEIAAARDAIRETWSEKELRSRGSGKPEAWTPPVVRCGD